MKLCLVIPEIRAKLWKDALSRNVEEYFKNSFKNPDAGDFQNLIGFSLSKARPISLVNCHKDNYVKLLTDRQTDKQTDRQANAEQNITSFGLSVCTKLNWQFTMNARIIYSRLERYNIYF